MIPDRPLKAIRVKCMDCSAGNDAEVRRCKLTDCVLWPFRMAHNPEGKHITSLKAIRLKCLDCCCDNPNEVALCPVEDCGLWAYRSGRNPKRAGLGQRGGRPDNFKKKPVGGCFLP